VRSSLSHLPRVHADDDDETNCKEDFHYMILTCKRSHRINAPAHKANATETTPQPIPKEKSLGSVSSFPHDVTIRVRKNANHTHDPAKASVVTTVSKSISHPIDVQEASLEAQREEMPSPQVFKTNGEILGLMHQKPIIPAQAEMQMPKVLVLQPELFHLISSSECTLRHVH
jgi:hypothetical protein